MYSITADNGANMQKAVSVLSDMQAGGMSDDDATESSMEMSETDTGVCNLLLKLTQLFRDTCCQVCVVQHILYN